MKIADIIVIRDKLKADLAVAERFLEIAKASQEPGEKLPLNGKHTEPGQRLLSLAESVPLPATGYGSIGRNVQAGIEASASRFSLRDVEDNLRRLGTPLARGQIATALARLVESDSLEIVEPRKGSRPATYSRKT